MSLAILVLTLSMFFSSFAHRKYSSKCRRVRNIFWYPLRKVEPLYLQGADFEPIKYVPAIEYEKSSVSYRWEANFSFYRFGHLTAPVQSFAKT